MNAPHKALALYASHDDPTTLLKRCGPMLDRCARALARRTGMWSSLDDFWSAGAMALLEAASRYSPTFGVRLETFLERRVRGAMLDELRRQDHVPRRLRQRARDIETARTALESSLGRAPTDEEVAAKAGVSLEELAAVTTLAHPLVPLGALAEEAASPTGYQRVVDGERLLAVARAVAQLPERLQVLLGLRYQEGLTFREIAEVLDVSEPRVCQLHAQAAAELRRRLDEEGWSS